MYKSLVKQMEIQKFQENINCVSRNYTYETKRQVEYVESNIKTFRNSFTHIIIICFVFVFFTFKM